MKQYILCSVLLLASVGLFAQLDAASVLTPVLGTDKVQGLQQSDPAQLEFLAFVNEKGFYFQDLGAHGKDISSYPNALEVPAKNEAFAPLSESIVENGFDLLAYNFPVSNTHYGYYRVADTGVLLVVYPLDLAKILFEKEQQ